MVRVNDLEWNGDRSMNDLGKYRDLIARKAIAFQSRGLTKWGNLPPSLFDHQNHGVEFALRTGCSAMFYDTGLGKTAMSLAWGDQIVRETNMPVLMLAPLAVGPQHAREAARLGIDASVIRDGSDATASKIYVINYDRVDKIDATKFGGVILDESSIIKSFSGQTTKALIANFAQTKYRLTCTATPAPNDHTELGNHAEFLGVMRRDSMLPIWFIHDSADTGNWKIKGHARDDFWRWVASWARCVSKPSDLGFSDVGFVLPELVTHRHEILADTTISTGAEKDGQARLFRIPEMSATSVHQEKRMTRDARAEKIAQVVYGEPNEPWIIWCDTNDEADALIALMPKDETVEVRGQQSPDEKERKLTDFSEGHARIIITKSSIAGFGLNWQHCARQAFVGLSFSYESYYQAVRRSWRFGQKRPVHVHVACADTERSIYEAVTRKAEDHGEMKDAMARAMRFASRSHDANKLYQPSQEASLPSWLVA
jgi:Helicase conserved C-terminal domain